MAHFLKNNSNPVVLEYGNRNRMAMRHRMSKMHVYNRHN